MRKDLRQKVDALRKPAVHLVSSREETGSWLGGLPSAEKEFEWPSTADAPMSFMGQIRLSDLPRPEGALPLPERGYLYFFFDTIDLQGCRVIWSAAETGLVEIPAPPQPPPPVPKGLRKLLGIKPKGPRFEIYQRSPVSFASIQTYPPTESDLLGSLEDEDIDEYTEFRVEVYGESPAHHFFGYPDPEQGDDMDLQCEIESSVVPPRLPQAFTDPAVLKAAKDWRLLLQLDEDGATGFTFVDVGKLYFWIRIQDAQTISAAFTPYANLVR